MKTSNQILLIVGIALLASAIFLSFYLEPYLTSPTTQPELAERLPPDAWKKDTLRGSYHYLWTNCPEVELNPLQEGLVEKLAYENASDRVRMEIKNDTLFILQNPPPDYVNFTNIIHNYRDPTNQIVVGAKTLHGIEAVDRGRIFHFRGMKDAMSVSEREYEPRNADVVPLTCDELEINLRRGGDAVLNVNANVIRVSLAEDSNFHTYSRLRLRGNYRTLYIQHRDCFVDVKTHIAQPDSVFIDSQTGFFGNESLLRVNAKNYLEAKIKGRTNIMYFGNPVIRKEEFHNGRLIDGNYYK